MSRSIQSQALTYLLLLSLSLLPSLLPAQEGCDIRIRFRGLRYDTLWFGSTFGREPIPEFYAVKERDGYFNLKTNKPLPPGMYAILFRRKPRARYEYISCWLADGQRQFTLEVSISQPRTPSAVMGSNENNLLRLYLNPYYTLKDQLESLAINYKMAQDEASFRAFREAEEDLQRFQEAFIMQNKGSLTAELVKQTRYLTPTDLPTDWQEAARVHLDWQRQHFFDQLNLAGDDFLQFPLKMDRTEFYSTLLPPPYPDTMTAMIEEVLVRMEPNPVTYRYYFSYLMKLLSKINRFRIDEVFVYFVREYLDQGKADWLGEDKLRQYRADAEKAEPVLTGRIIPDVTLYDTTGAAVSIHEVDAPYTLLFLWLYDCSHCKEEIPVMKSLHGRFQSKGLKVLSVCGKTGEEESRQCREFARQMDMPAGWLLLNDPQRRSRFWNLLNVQSYPCMFLLDAEKKILYKQMGSAPVEVLEKLFLEYFD